MTIAAATVSRDTAAHLAPSCRNSISLITFVGIPAAITRGGRSSVTTELAPITQRSPIFTPLVTTQLAPNQQLDPIRTGPFEVNPCQVIGWSGSSKRWAASPTKQPFANSAAIAHLDPLQRRQHHVAVKEAALADLDPGLRTERQPAAGLEQAAGADHQAALIEALQYLALDRVADV